MPWIRCESKQPSTSNSCNLWAVLHPQPLTPSAFFPVHACVAFRLLSSRINSPNRVRLVAGVSVERVYTKAMAPEHNVFQVGCMCVNCTPQLHFLVNLDRGQAAYTLASSKWQYMRLDLHTRPMHTYIIVFAYPSVRRVRWFVKRICQHCVCVLVKSSGGVQRYTIIDVDQHH